MYDKINFREFNPEERAKAEEYIREMLREVGASDLMSLIGSHFGDEIRITDPDTGGMKGMKSTRFDLLPWTQLEKVAQHYAKGAIKYGEHNWRKGYSWSLSFAALERHAASFWSGEDLDPETQSHHLVAVVFHALALLEFTETHPEKDDRYKGGE